MSVRIGIVCLAIMLILPMFAVGSPASDNGRNITIGTDRFGAGGQKVTLSFNGAGSNQNTKLSLQSGLIIDSASFKVNASPIGGQGSSSPYNISIDIGADGDPEWQFSSLAFGQLGHQTNFVNGDNRYNISFATTGGSNSDAAIRLPKNAKVTNATLEVTGGGPGNPGWALVYAADYSGYVDAHTKLKNNFPNDFTRVDLISQSNAPTLETLSKYQSVLVYSDPYYGYSFNEYDKLGNVLVDYIQLGGGVVLGYGAYYYTSYGIGGKFLSDNYYVMPYGTSYNYYTDYLGTYNSSHPLMENVTSFGNYYLSPWTYSVNPGATVVASYSYTGRPLVAEKTFNGNKRVDLGFIPVSDNHMYFGYYSYTDGDDIIRNAMLYAGRKEMNCSVDILGDGTVDWKNEALKSSEKVPDFTNLLNDYLATAQPSGTDGYGNQYVDIPMTVNSTTAGRVGLGNMSISYEYTGTVDINPIYGNLAKSLNQLIPQEIGSENISIPIKVSTASAGKVNLHSLSITGHPPNHAPSILNQTPARDITISETESVDMSIDCIDIYGNPLTYQWYLNGISIPESTTSQYTFTSDYASSGKYKVKVVVDNGLANTSFEWVITVTNFNRPPTIVSFSPQGAPVIEENQSIEFRLNATDPDGDALRYSWFVNGMEKLGINTNYMWFSTRFDGAGLYDIKVVTADSGGLTVPMAWALNVTNVNREPIINAFHPPSTAKITETETMTFSVMASDPDSQTLTYKWYLNNVQVSTATQYQYQSNYDSAGNHDIRVEVSDGEQVVSLQWALTVENLNRAPTAVIDSPVAPFGFMNTDQINFSAKTSRDPDGDTLKYRWYEFGTDLSTQSEFKATFAAGSHEVMLEVTDGNGGKAVTSVKFVVTFVMTSTEVHVDRSYPNPGDIVTVTVVVRNSGTAPSDASTVDLLIDGRSVATKDIGSTRAGGTQTLTFLWNATKEGSHLITANMDGNSANTTVKVVGTTSNAVMSEGDSGTLLVGIVALVGVVIVCGFLLVSRRKSN